MLDTVPTWKAPGPVDGRPGPCHKLITSRVTLVSELRLVMNVVPVIRPLIPKTLPCYKKKES